MGLTFNNGRNAAAMTSNSSLNVGIGSSSPSTNSLIRELLLNQSVTNGVSKLSLKTDYNSQSGEISMSSYLSENTMFIATLSNSPIAFNTNNTERMRITSAGNVGIGSSSITNGTAYGGGAQVNVLKLSSSGYPALEINTSSGGGGSLQFTYGSNLPNQVGGFLSYNYASGTVNELNIWNQLNGGIVIGTNNSIRMVITNGGNIGIGITNPTQTFQVYSTASTTSSIFETNAVNSYIALKSTSGTNYIGNVSYGMSFEAGGSERMRISSTGNVGIGTSSPLQALGTTLTVAGTLLSNPSASGGNYNENIRANRAGNGYSAIAIGSAYNTVSGTGTGQWTLVATPAGLGYRFDFDYAGATKSYIDTSGNYVVVSDRNKKKDFEDSTIGLNAILGLKPTLYRMKDEDDSSEKQLGFIAQEVNEFIPQAYSETLDGFIGLQDRPIIAALVKAVQELEARIKTLENK